ncbi:prominin-like protein isoform X2 [Drosophila takahashii]
MHHLYVINYDQLVKIIQEVIPDKANVTEFRNQLEVQAEEIENLSEVLKNLPYIKPLMKRFNEELPSAKRLATRLRNALQGIKLDLTAFLTSQCKQKECLKFYREQSIRMLDKGCLQYDNLPKTEPLLKSVQEVTDSRLIAYPQKAVQQLQEMSQAIRNQMRDLLKAIKKDVDKSAKELQKRYEASLKVLRGVIDEMRKNQRIEVKEKHRSRSNPVGALRRKLGSSWYGTTIGIVVLMMLVPLLLLSSLLVALSSPKVASWLLCITLILIFILFSICIFLVLFYLVHGALLYQAFCIRKPPQPLEPKYINPNEYLPENFTIPQSLPMLTTSDILHSCLRNESLYNILNLREVYNLEGFRKDVMKDVWESLEKIDTSLSQRELGYIHPKAARMAVEFLRGNLSRYESKFFTKHLCPELVPEPKPGSLTELTIKLDNLADTLKSGSTLRDQTAYLKAFERHLGKPLASKVQRLMEIINRLDQLLSGGYGNFAKYLNYLLAKIHQGDEFLRYDAKNVTDEVARNISGFVESYLNVYIRMVDEETKGEMESCEPLTRVEDQAKAEYNDLCNRIAKPMNAIWFWLFLFSLLLLPVICCTHLLRCRLKSLRNLSEATLVSLGEGNFVAPGMLPVGLPQCLCYRYLPVNAETNVDYLEESDDFYVDQPKRKRE